MSASFQKKYSRERIAVKTKSIAHVAVDAGRILGELKHGWRYIGYDECNYTHTPEGEKLIAKFGKLKDAPYFIRVHHLLCTGNCHGVYKWGSTNVYTEDEHGTPSYSWEVIDEIFDIFLRNNCKPFVELGFMPMDLVDPEVFQKSNVWTRFRRYQDVGWATPPKDYQKWQDLIMHLVQHCVERFGREEVLTWYWELWNEPDIIYWKGTTEEFSKLYDHTEAAVHTALPEARLAGPAICMPLPGNPGHRFLEAFLEHCSSGTNHVTGEKGTRLDYVTFHVKGGGFPFMLNAPKQTPSIKLLLKQVKLGLETIQKHGYGDREVVLSETDPDGWAAGGTHDNINMDFRNTEYYASYVASSYHHIDRVGQELQMDVRPLAWAFMFVGERCFEGTRTFSTQGIDKAVFNLFRLYAGMGRKRLALECDREEEVLNRADNAENSQKPDISGMAALTDDGAIQVMVHSHHDDWDVDEVSTVELQLENLPFSGPARVVHYRIDQAHSNAYAEWINQGRPIYPDQRQYESISARSGLEKLEPDETVEVEDGILTLTFPMPTHAISMVEISSA